MHRHGHTPKKEAEFLWFQLMERAQILFYKPAAREICHPS